MRTAKNLRRRSRQYSPKPKLKIRRKARPQGCSFNIEVRLLPVPETVYRQGGRVRSARMEDLEMLLDTVREMCSEYKIIRHTRRVMRRARILLKSDADLMIVLLADSDLIYRIYRYA